MERGGRRAEGAGLAEYRRKRDFDRTREPEGAPRRKRRGRGEPVFVVQHHVARREHYDFRLEVDGVLKSWAVPRGPSTDPRAKRLAVPTEDHPLDYAEFEGTIPAGEYGGGTVLVWDTGTYTNTTSKKGRELTMAEGLEHGHVSFRLHGEKLSGGYALNRFRGDDGEEAWLLVKEKDAAADPRTDPVSTRPESVRTGRVLAEVADDDGRTLQGRPRDPGADR
ncbi:DNA polymerase ligase N-terminal domain-containing protein [Streptomonospora nanhaiensis]|uniref:Bifunctional non-homologous end joining protein LigD n=1 Tax=Streptomonospora nanhaiensis TaxID=1323731 RepID=A0A853BHN5_9ACTN|nr:DNA polymerase ligase N-terminal domain-containing protein [Streptomonospora nanhaiensis]MBV2362525.1 DNA ligase [Streptomonospora nanhaiensis]MBX9389313.1 DNA ligase [Streptomonospora nanhaiensis]NYI94813.1 bifunctional non-homologous end joining protein LigD [Streptomonospora nanhaiensis]